MQDGQPARQSSDRSAGPACRPTRPEPAEPFRCHRPPPTQPELKESALAPARQSPAIWPAPPAEPGSQKRSRPAAAMPTPASPRACARVPVGPAIARGREPPPRQNPQSGSLRQQDHSQAPAANDPAVMAALADQKAEFGSIKNACSASVDTRPRMALR